MNKRILSRAIVVLLLTGLLVSLINLAANQMVRVAAQQAEPTTFEADVPVRGVYLLSDDNAVWWDNTGDGVNEEHHIENPLIVDLAAAGFKPGGLILISSQGRIRFAVDGAPDWYTDNPTCSGVFSSSDTLLWDRSQEGQVGPLHRVPDAIDVGVSYVTPDTYYGKVSNDIPEDFGISGSGTSIRIPSGAVYLMLAVVDTGVSNNDGWIKVTIEKEQDTSSPIDINVLLIVAILVIVAAVAVVLIVMRKKRKSSA
jgi:hypothetical protein